MSRVLLVHDMIAVLVDNPMRLVSNIIGKFGARNMIRTMAVEYASR